MKVTIDIDVLKRLRMMRDSWRAEGDALSTRCADDLDAEMREVWPIIEPIALVPAGTPKMLVMYSPPTRDE